MIEQPPFICVRCESPLSSDDPSRFSCRRCGASFCRIAGISILHPSPIALLRAHQLELGGAASPTVRLARPPEMADDELSRKALALWLRAQRAAAANVALVRQLSAPIEQFLASTTEPERPFSYLSLPVQRWPFALLLPYVYRDWGGTEEAELAASLFRSAIAVHARDASGSLAVLGCGAGGLVYRLSDLFPASFGVDISIPGLLFARHLTEGGELSLALPLPRPTLPKTIARIAVRRP